jgi:hypothetical protein
MKTPRIQAIAEELERCAIPLWLRGLRIGFGEIKDLFI